MDKHELWPRNIVIIRKRILVCCNLLQTSYIIHSYYYYYYYKKNYIPMPSIWINLGTIRSSHKKETHIVHHTYLFEWWSRRIKNHYTALRNSEIKISLKHMSYPNTLHNNNNSEEAMADSNQNNKSNSIRM